MDLTPIGPTSLTTATQALVRRDSKSAARALDVYLEEVLRAARLEAERTLRRQGPGHLDTLNDVLRQSRFARMTQPNFSTLLPAELWLLVFEHLLPADLARACAASSYFGAVGGTLATHQAFRSGVQTTCSIGLPEYSQPMAPGEFFVRSPTQRDVGAIIQDNWLRVARTPGLAPLAFAQPVGQAVCAPSWSPTDGRLACLARLPHGVAELSVFDPTQSASLNLRLRLRLGDPSALAWSGYTPGLIAVGLDNHVSLVNLDAPLRDATTLIDVCDRRPVSQSNPQLAPSVLAWSPSHPLLAVNTASKLNIYDAQPWNQPRMAYTLDAKVRAAAQVAWQPGTKRIAVCAEDTLQIWDLEQGEARVARAGVGPLTPAASAPDAVAWSYQGDLVAVLRGATLRVFWARSSRPRIFARRLTARVDRAPVAAAVEPAGPPLHRHPWRVECLGAVCALPQLLNRDLAALLHIPTLCAASRRAPVV